jgi:hypothetical protein
VIFRIESGHDESGFELKLASAFFIRNAL